MTHFQHTRSIQWTVADGNPFAIFTVPEYCAHAKAHRAQSCAASAANSLKNYGQCEWVRS
jgi:hypothetical protein